MMLLLLVQVLFLPENATFLQKKKHQKGGLSTRRYIFLNYKCICTYVPNFKFLV